MKHGAPPLGRPPPRYDFAEADCICVCEGGDCGHSAIPMAEVGHCLFLDWRIAVAGAK